MYVFDVERKNCRVNEALSGKIAKTLIWNTQSTSRNPVSLEIKKFSILTQLLCDGVFTKTTGKVLKKFQEGEAPVGGTDSVKPIWSAGKRSQLMWGGR